MLLAVLMVTGALLAGGWLAQAASSDGPGSGMLRTLLVVAASAGAGIAILQMCPHVMSIIRRARRSWRGPDTCLRRSTD